MLTFKRVKIAFLIITVLALIEYYFFQFSWYYLLQIPILYFAFIAYGSANIRSGFFMKSRCKADTNNKILAITFDDGPDPVKTPLILDVLREHNVKATFFVIGKKIKGSENILQKIKEEGHLLANHSFSHSYFFDFFSTKKVCEDLITANNEIKKAIELPPLLFRPPYGVTNPNIAKAVEKLKLTSIGWDVRSLDTVIQDSERLYKRVSSRIRPGSILLFHDTGSNTLEALKQVILFARENGYTIIALDQMLNLKAYEEL